MTVHPALDIYRDVFGDDPDDRATAILADLRAIRSAPDVASAVRAVPDWGEGDVDREQVRQCRRRLRSSARLRAMWGEP